MNNRLLHYTNKKLRRWSSHTNLPLDLEAREKKEELYNKTERDGRITHVTPVPRSPTLTQHTRHESVAPRHV